MEQVLHGLHWKTLLLYLDDVIIISPDFENHLQRLQDVFDRLQDAGLKLKPSKCELLQDEVHYLGHVVSADGVATDPDKVAAVRQWEAPKDVKALQAFLGTAGYYRQYLPDFATVAKPLTRLISGDNPWTWGTEEQVAFQRLKDDLVSAPVLGYPDPKLPYILDTDASAVGVGAVLSQIQEGKERVIAYYSKTLAPPERNYCVTRRELLAVVKAMKHFRPYLYGTKFKLRTDHASLRWLCRRHEPSAQVARWLEIMSAFSYELEHRAGKRHGNADGLSRQTPCLDCKQCAAIEQRDGGPSRAEIEAELRAADQVVKVQAQDPVAKDQATGRHAVAQIYAAVKTGEPLTPEELQLGGTELKRLHARREALRIRPDGILEIRLVVNQKARWCVICPPSIRKTVIWETHGLAHAGMNRTMARVQLNWYWPGMVADVRRILKTCEVCQVAKPGGNKPPGSRQRLYVGRPWQKVAIDLVGPMPKTRRGNQWILVLTDHFTRWQDALPLPDATAPTVATTLDERVFCYFGLPEQIHSVLGRQFQSQLMSELCALWQVQQTHTTPYHPQANGVVERGNRVLGDALRALLLERSQEDWDLVLPQLLRAFRGTPQSGTGETANLLMLGRELRLPDLLMNSPPPREYQAQAEYTQDLIDRLAEAHDMLRHKQMDIRQEDSEEPPLFQSGDLVLLQNMRRRKGEAPKLQPKFVGPYEVVEAFKNHTYLLERLGQTTVQNECRLKLYRPCTERAGQAPGMLGETGCKTSVKNKKKLTKVINKHCEQAARRPVQNNVEDFEYIAPNRTPQDGEEEINVHLPDDENPLPEMAAYLNPERLPVIPEENETDDSENETGSEISTPKREDNSLQERLTEVEELPAPTTTRSGRISRMPSRFQDYMCSEVRNFITQDPNSYIGKRWMSVPLRKKLTPLAETLGFQQQREIRPFISEQLTEMDASMDIEATLNEMLAQETNDGMEFAFSEEELLRDTNQITSTTVHAATTAVNRVACKEIQDSNDTSLSATATLVCKITKEDTTYFDVRNNKDNVTEAAVCKTTEPISTDTEVRRPVCKITEPTCKTVELINQYFNDEENPRPKINLMRTLKDGEVYPRAGKRRHQLARYITSMTDEKIKAGARKEKCDRCNYTTSKKKMHLHFRQHFTKHFCSCGYTSASYDSIYQHQKYGHCRESSRTIYEVDRNSYPRFLRHVGWRSAQPFGECRPTLDGEGRRTLTYSNSSEQRPSIQDRLGEPVRIRQVRDPAAEEELRRLERQALWHAHEAERYKERARKWRRTYNLD